VAVAHRRTVTPLPNISTSATLVCQQRGWGTERRGARPQFPEPGQHGHHEQQHPAPGTRPPAGLETKGAATMLAPTPTAPTPDTATVTPEGVVELIAAVTGIQDEVGDVIRPGAFRRTIAERRPKVCSSHRWDQPIGRVLSIEELLPGDPRLPRTTGDGRAWPRAAGALIATAQLNMGTKAGREAFEVIRFFGPAESAFSTGYKVTPGGTTHRGGVRHITDLDLFEISAVLHGANRYATLLSVKGAAPVLETKATSGVVAARRRAGAPVASPCSVCGRPAAAVVPGGLRAGETLICSRCVEVADDHTATATLSAGDIADLDELTSDGPVTRRATVAVDLVVDRRMMPSEKPADVSRLVALAQLPRDDLPSSNRSGSRRPISTLPIAQNY